MINGLSSLELEVKSNIVLCVLIIVVRIMSRYVTIDRDRIVSRVLSCPLIFHGVGNYD